MSISTSSFLFFITYGVVSRFIKSLYLFKFLILLMYIFPAILIGTNFIIQFFF